MQMRRMYPRWRRIVRVMIIQSMDLSAGDINLSLVLLVRVRRAASRLRRGVL